MPKNVLTVRNEVLEETVHQETFEGDERAASRRLGELWNEFGAHLPDRGMVATAAREGGSDPWDTIEG